MRYRVLSDTESGKVILIDSDTNKPFSPVLEAQEFNDFIEWYGKDDDSFIDKFEKEWEQFQDSIDKFTKDDYHREEAEAGIL